MRNTHYSCRGHHGRPRSSHRVHPPFPSFAWVMTAQANPPTRTYAYGYVQNAHAQTQTRPSAPCAARHGCYQPNPRSAEPLLPPAQASAGPSPAAPHETFMKTVDYRYHDPLTQPYVEWRAGPAPCETQRLPPLAKKNRLDSVLRALRRICGLSKGTKPGRTA